MDEFVNNQKFMTGRKLNQLFQAARRETAPEPPPDFADALVRTLRREPPSPPPGEPSLFDELNALFPRLALAALLVMALGVAANLALGTSELTDWDDSLPPVSTQWFLLPDGD